MSSSLPAGDQLVVRGGNAHFFTYTRIRSRETGENRRINEQTKHGVTKGRGRCCNTICMCIPDSRYRLTLARVTSENSTMLLESDILRLFFTGLYLVSSPLCSGVWCWLPLRGLQPQLPSAPVQLPLLVSCHQLPTLSLSGPCLSLGRVINSHSPPRTTSGYGEISCPKMLCLVSRQNRQLNRLLWLPTPIVLLSKVTTMETSHTQIT